MAKLGGVRNKAEMHIIFGPVSYQYVRSALALDRSCCSLDCRRADKARPPTLHGIGTPARAPHYRGEWVIDHFVIAPIASPAMKRICPQSLPPRYVYTTTPILLQYINIYSYVRARDAEQVVATSWIACMHDTKATYVLLFLHGAGSTASA